MQHAARGGIQESEYAVYNAVLDLIYASSYRNKYVDSIYPVSYTHLDVYKRQQEYPPVCAGYD